VTARLVVAFDLDGTLVDSSRDIGRALSGGLADLGALPAGTLLSDAVVRPWIGHGARALCVAATAALASTVDVDALLARFRARYAEGLVVDTAPYPGVVDALRALRDDGLALAVATNKPGAFARPIVDALLPATFAVVVGPDDVGPAKPDPAMLVAAGRAAGGPVAAYVGDSDVDVATAQRAGVPFVGVGWGIGPITAGGLVVDAAGMVDAVRAIVAERS
jgi:phosphoglycolate phosphatase